VCSSWAVFVHVETVQRWSTTRLCTRSASAHELHQLFLSCVNFCISLPHYTLTTHCSCTYGLPIARLDCHFMTYYVSSGTLNPTHSLTHSDILEIMPRIPTFLVLSQRAVTRQSQLRDSVVWHIYRLQNFPSLTILLI